MVQVLVLPFTFKTSWFGLDFLTILTPILWEADSNAHQDISHVLEKDRTCTINYQKKTQLLLLR